jgi:hypothetical protein
MNTGKAFVNHYLEFECVLLKLLQHALRTPLERVIDHGG